MDPTPYTNRVSKKSCSFLNSNYLYKTGQYSFDILYKLLVISIFSFQILFDVPVWRVLVEEIVGGGVHHEGEDLHSTGNVFLKQEI